MRQSARGFASVRRGLCVRYGWNLRQLGRGSGLEISSIQSLDGKAHQIRQIPVAFDAQKEAAARQQEEAKNQQQSRVSEE